MENGINSKIYKKETKIIENMRRKGKRKRKG